MDDIQFRIILDRLGLSWKGYRRVRKGAKKRLGRHMQQLQCATIEDYMSALAESPEKLKQAKIDLAVSISRFFRDRQMWKILESHILPNLITREDPVLKVWSAGCSSGEEVYSLRLLWDVVQKRMGNAKELQIWATDINPTMLARARAGVYPPGSLKDVSQEWQSAYFSLIPDGKRSVRDFLKSGIHWDLRNVWEEEPPNECFDLVFMRNHVLTYAREEFRGPVLAGIVERLRNNGYLVIGAHEKLPASFPFLHPDFENPMIFQKIEQPP